MRKNFKLVILIIISTLLVAGTINVVATRLYAKDIKFISNDSEWKVDNVEDAMNGLYNKLDTSGAKFIGFGHRYSSNGNSVPIGYIYDFENSLYTGATFYDDRYYYIENDYIKYVSLYEGTVYPIDHSLTIKKSGYYDILYVFAGEVKMSINHQYIESGTVYDLDDSHSQMTMIVVGY